MKNTFSKMDWFNYVIKNWPAFLILITGIAAVIGTFFSSAQDSAQKNNIEKLALENKGLASNIQQLSNLNNQMTCRIEELVIQHKKISDNNLAISKQSNEMIVSVNELTEKISRLSEGIDANVKYAATENLQTSMLLSSFDPKTDRISMGIGTLTAQSDLEKFRRGEGFIIINGKDLLSYFFNGDSFLLNFKVFDLDGNVIAEVDDNNWRANKHFSGKMNYDDKGFEVSDKSGKIIFSVDLPRPNTFNLQGVFVFKDANVIIIIDQGGFVWYRFDELSDEIRTEIANVKCRQLFEYTGSDWLGKRRKN